MSTSGRRTLVLYTEDHRNLPAVLDATQVAGHKVRLWQPRWARPLKALAVETLAAETADPAKVLGDTDLIVLPSVPDSLIKLLASPDEESPTIRLVRQARRRGIPMVALAADTQAKALAAVGIAPVTIKEVATPEKAIAELPSCDTCAKQSTCAVRCSGRVQDLVTLGAARIGAGEGVGAPNPKLARMIDHTLLKADATEDEIRKLCAEARQQRFMSVCVNPGWVKLSAQLLKDSGVKVCTVVGFPLGATDTATKVFETQEAIRNGATEIDMVINVGALKSKDYETVENDIRGVVQACPKGIVSKVILETALLDDEQKVVACALSKSAGADFVKTSTGFSTGGATVRDIALMRATVGPELGVKASGGIRDTRTAQDMIAAGATRIGASASVAIVKGVSAGAGSY